MVGIEVAADVRHELGESVLWDDRTGELVWVNIHRREIWRRNATGSLIRHELPDRVGAIGLRQGPGYVVALAKGFGLFDPARSRYEPIAPIEIGLPNTRLNDGRCDRSGNFVCGGMSERGLSGKPSALYRFRADGTVETLLGDIMCANSTCFSPDGKTMYFADMPTGIIRAYCYGPDAPLGASRLFFDFAGRSGLPDGSIVDSEGFLWNAHWGAGRVTRHAPDGSVEREIVLPVTNPTCLAFGGADLRTLFISSATFQLSAETLAGEPLAGAILSIRVEVPGIPEPRFAC